MHVRIWLFFVLILFVVQFVMANTENAQQIRGSFLQGFEDQDKANELHTLLEGKVEDGAFFRAYLGATKALLANHTQFIPAKYNYARQSVKLLDEAVELAPGDIEIRFLRFNIQNEIPSFLGMSRNVEEDRRFILESFAVLSLKNTDAAEMIAEYMVQSAGLDAENKQLFLAYLNR